MLHILLLCLICISTTLQVGSYPTGKSAHDHLQLKERNGGYFNQRSMIDGSLSSRRKYRPPISSSPFKTSNEEHLHHYPRGLDGNQPLSKTTQFLLNLYKQPVKTRGLFERSAPKTFPLTQKSNREHFANVRGDKFFNSRQFGQPVFLAQGADFPQSSFLGNKLPGKDVAFTIGSPAGYCLDDFEQKSYCKRCSPGFYPEVLNTFGHPSLLHQYFSEPAEDLKTVGSPGLVGLMKRLLQDVLSCDESEREDFSDCQNRKENFDNQKIASDSDCKNQRENYCKKLKSELPICLNDYANDECKTVRCLCKLLKAKDDDSQSDHKPDETMMNYNNTPSYFSYESSEEESGEVSEECTSREYQCPVCEMTSPKGYSDEPANDSGPSNTTEKPDGITMEENSQPEKSSKYPSESEPESPSTTPEYPGETAASTTDQPDTTSEYPAEREARTTTEQPNTSSEDPAGTEPTTNTKQPDTTPEYSAETESATTTEQPETNSEYPAESESATTTEQPETTSEYPAETESATSTEQSETTSEYPAKTESASTNEESTTISEYPAETEPSTTIEPSSTTSNYPSETEETTTQQPSTASEYPAEAETTTTTEQPSTTSEYSSENEPATTAEQPATTSEAPSETEAAATEQQSTNSDAETPSESPESTNDDDSSYASSSSYSKSSSGTY